MWKYIKNNNRSQKLLIFGLAFLFFLSISVIFFWRILFSEGIVLGQDWMFPVNTHQMEEYTRRPFYTWTYDMNLFGVKNPFSVQMPFVLLVKLFLLLGLNGEILSKVIIIMAFTLSGTSMFLLLKFLGLKDKISILGGFMFITMPVFFNYTIMGWCFVLLSVGTLLPITIIFFIKSVEEKKIVYSIICGLLYSIAILQSQSLVWFPMVFFALSFYLVKNKETLWLYLKSTFIIVMIALAIHSTWWPNLFINHDQGVMNSDLVLDSVSQGMRSRLSFVNILRAWGSLFNQFYEISYPGILAPLSYLVPFMAFASLIIKKINKRDIRIPLAIIFLYMFILFAISPSAMAKIPLSNLVRDTARFTALASFAVTVLASYFVSYLFEGNNRRKIIAYLLVLLVALNSFSFFSGALTGEPKNIYDVRLRNYRFPNDYNQAENYLYSIKTDAKSYYPPSGTNISIKDNPVFNAGFREIKDPFRGYSPLPGTIYMYYSSMGKPTKISSLLDSLFDSRIDKNSLSLMGMMNIGYIIIRNDIEYPETQVKNIKDFLSDFKNDVFNIGEVQVVKNKYFLPHFYIPDKLVYSSNSTEVLPDVVSFYQDSERLGVHTEPEPTLKSDSNKDEPINSRVAENSDEIFIEASESIKKKHKIYIPRNGKYILYTSKGIQVNFPEIGQPISSTGEVLKINGNNILEQGEVDLSKGWHDVEIYYQESINLADAEKWEPSVILRSVPALMVSDSGSNQVPKIKFTKINNTKYKIEVEGAKNPYTLAFSESYHDGWSVYLEGEPELKSKWLNFIGKTFSKIIGIFTKNSDASEEAASYFNGDIKEIFREKTFLEPDTFETWGKKPIAQTSHFLINGYANSWYITPEDVGGKENYELVVEFEPQKFFYIGLFVLITTLLLCTTYLGWVWIKKIL